MDDLKIYDLDGCTIDSSHRYKINKNNRIDLDHWRENSTPEKIAMDSLLPHAEQMINDINDSNTTVIIATARVMSKADFDFIDHHIGDPDFIVHRLDEHDHRSGIDLKVNGVNSCLNIHDFESISIYEDNFDYLMGITDIFESMGHKSVYPIFVPSNQGY